MSTLNKFKRTSVAGQFRNVDLPGGTDDAAAYFQRDVEIGGDIRLGTETLVDEIYTNTGGNICFNISGVAYQITPVLLTQLIGLAATLSQKSDISYVDNKIAQIVDSSPTTLDTLNELAAALGDDPNFATTVASNIGLKADKSYTDAQLLLKADKTYTDSQLANKISNNTSSAISGYLHYNNFNTPYDRFQTGSFGSIASNRAGGGGHGSLDFIQNGYGITNLSTRAFSFMIATSNTTFNELLRINKNGDMIVTGNVSSPTITAINSNITTINTSLSGKVESTTYTSGILNLQNQIDTIELTEGAQGPQGPIGLTGAQGPIGLTGPVGSFSAGSDIVCTNIDVSGTITNPALTNSINSKTDLSYTDAQLLLKADKTYTDAQLLLKADKSYTDAQLLLKADKTYTDAQLANKISNNTSSAISGYLHYNNFNDPYDRFQTGSFGSIAVNRAGGGGHGELSFIQNGFGISNLSTRAFSFMIATSNTTFTELLKINKNGDMIVTGNVTSPTITTINSNIALKTDKTYTDAQLLLKADKTYTDAQLLLKADKTYTDAQLLLKADKTYTDSQLANKISNNTSSAISGYLHYSNFSAPYDQFQTASFGSIASNRAGGGGHGELSFIQNGFGISNLSTRAFSFMIATSNTTFNELLRINKNGDMIVTGNVSSPTITAINSNISLKEDTTAVNAKLALKADLTYTNTQLALKDDITSVNTKLALKSSIESPVFTGIVSAPIYQGNVSRSSTTSPVVFTASTLPAVIFKDAGVSTGSFGIPDMPIGTKFTVVKTCPSVTLYSTSGSVFFYTNRTSPFWQGTITFNEDSRTFIRAEIFTTTTMSMVQVWLTESSYSYSFNNNVLKSMVGAYFLDGGNNGINSENMRPIICSTALFSPGNSDDGYIINEGFSLLLYPDSNYGGTPISLSNYNVNEDPKPVYYVSPMVNNMQSLKLYYNLVEVTILNIS